MWKSWKPVFNFSSGFVCFGPEQDRPAPLDHTSWNVFLTNFRFYVMILLRSHLLSPNIVLKLAVSSVSASFLVAPKITLAQFLRTDCSMKIVAVATPLHGDIRMCATCVQNHCIISMSMAESLFRCKAETKMQTRERAPPTLRKIAPKINLAITLR